MDEGVTFLPIVFILPKRPHNQRSLLSFSYLHYVDEVVVVLIMYYYKLYCQTGILCPRAVPSKSDRVKARDKITVFCFNVC